MDNQPVDIGVITGAHGLRGVVVLHLFNQASDLPLPEMVICLRRPNGARQKIKVLGVQDASKGLLVQLEGIDDRNLSESLKGCVIEVDRSDLPTLEEDEFYYRDIIGADVSLPDNSHFGKVTDIFQAATDILVILTDAGEELLVPVVDQFVLSISTTAVVIDPKGLETD